MPIRHLVAALLLGSVAVPAAAQDAQSLIAKNLEARGGEAALSAIKSIKFKGRSIAPGDFELTYEETHERVGPSAAADRVDLTVQGLDLVQAYDGHGNGWKINPFQGRKDAEKMSGDEARSMADGALIEGPLLASLHDGSRVDYLGRDDFDGTLAYKLKVTQTDGDEFTYWLDPDTYLEIKVEERRKLRGAEQTNETELGDYEKVAGVYFPMSVESWSQGQDNQRQRTIIASGEANVAAPADYFAEPGGAATPAKAAGQPPDASNKPHSKGAAKSKPGAVKGTAVPSTSPKGE
ncbi:MAG TPA: hypothetical protein VFW35_04465 [Sphingomicrobium sp.]|nr:hypothetical protein [Sphingomicrobium sp.]